VTGEVSHARRTPLRHRFRTKVYLWLVDLDLLPNERGPRLPRWLRPFSTFRAADHIGDPDGTIKANIERFCAAQGVDVSGHRILMLANARVLGHTFDPRSVFWAVASDDSVTCVVAEVHNTYGERHAYLVRTDDAGRSRTDKAFYVSPFFPVDGSYDLQFRLADDVVASTVVLRQGGSAVFSATFRGTPRPVTARRLARLVLTKPLMTQRTSLLIRVHGVWLWLRRLPIVPRPVHPPQEGTR
jgi:DUF1365 family protein